MAVGFVEPAFYPPAKLENKGHLAGVVAKFDVLFEMKSIPPRGSGWVCHGSLKWSQYHQAVAGGCVLDLCNIGKLIDCYRNPPATAWWYWLHFTIRGAPRTPSNFLLADYRL